MGETGSNKYLKFIAYLQIIGILLVVWGHSLHEYPDGDAGHSTLLYRMPQSFRMPLFIFVSGVLMVYTMRIRQKAQSVKVFVTGKMKRLLVPYIVLTLVTFVPRSMMSGMADDTVEMSWNGFTKAFLYSDCMPIPYLWFLQTSFTLLAGTYAIIMIGRKFRIGELWIYGGLLILYILVAYLPFETTSLLSLNRTVSFGMYFALGCVYGRYMKVVNRFIPWASVILLVLLVALWGGMFFITENTDYFPVCSLLGIMMCISAAQLLEKHKLGFLDHLMGTNYIIFLLSWYLNVLTQQVLAHYVSLPWWCYTILSLVAGIYVPWAMYRYMEHHPTGVAARMSRRLLGQSFKSRR